MSKQIHSLQELFTYAGMVASGQAKYEPVELVGSNENFAFSVHIEGDSWDKRVDARLAKYVLALQDSFDDLVEEHGDTEAFDEPLRVKVETREGSSIPWTEIKDILSKLVTPMTPEQTFIAVMTCLAGIGGYFFWARYIKSKEYSAELAKEQKIAELDAQKQAVALHAHEETMARTLDALLTVAQRDPSAYSHFERPPRQLVNALEEDDNIAIAEGPSIAASVARKMSPKRAPRTSEIVTYADGDYTLDKTNYTEGEVILELSQGDTQVKAYVTQLDKKDETLLLNEINERQQTETLPLTLKLHVNIVHTARQIKYAVVVGLGDPRPNKEQHTLSEIVSTLR